MKKGYKFLLVLAAIGIIVLIAFWIFIAAAYSGAFEKTVTQKETVENFRKHEKDIMDFADLLFANKQADHEILLSVKGDIVSFSLGLPGWAVHENRSNRHFNFSISKLDKDNPFLHELGWDAATCKAIIEAFKKTNCENASTNYGEINLSFRTGSWSSYSYQVRATPMTDTMLQRGDTGVLILNKRVTIGRTTSL